MQVLIGVDGGGTSCRAQAELPNGQRTPVFSGGAANIASDFDSALHEIASILAQVIEAARAMIPDAPALAPRIVLGLAGASETGADAQLRAALPYRDVLVCGDIDISLSGAFGDRDGIVMAVGTGSVLACQKSGQIRRLGGYGLTLGDEGSGAWIGRAALQHALHARDGLSVTGPLVDAVTDRFPTLPDIIAFASSARPADFAALAPLVLEHDRLHCPVAGAILDQSCAYLLRALNQLNTGAQSLPVAPLGGLGAAMLARIIAQGNAHLHCVAPKGTGLDGALWKARHGAVSG